MKLGLTVPSHVKTSIAPGSRIASDYFAANGLQASLDALGFETVGYGCTTCIGNSGPLNPELEQAVKENNIIGASVLSGNRNFEARIHASIKTNFLMSPPLVVAFALAGRVDIDFQKEPLGTDKNGKPVFLKDIWPSSAEIAEAVAKSRNPEAYRELYTITPDKNPRWAAVHAPSGSVFQWNENSTYIQNPPFFCGFNGQTRTLADITDARPLGIFGDSVTTDHILPRRSHPGNGSRRSIPAIHGRLPERLQLLRLPPRQRPRHDPRHLCQRPHQEPDGGRNGRRLHAVLREQGNPGPGQETSPPPRLPRLHLRCRPWPMPVITPP